MRPLRNIPPDKKQFHYPVAALLMASMGECCAMCERPIMAENLVLNRQNFDLIRGNVAPGQWSHMLLLCHNCGLSAKENEEDTTKKLIFPDREITFQLGRKSIFQYTLETVDTFISIEGNQPLKKITPREVVLIKGRTEAAKNTIAFFRLNSNYYNSEENILILPQTEDLHKMDRRLDLRTRAWDRAQSMLELFQQVEQKEIKTAMITNIRNSIRHGGFWSIWLTAFKKRVTDKHVLEEIFGQGPVPLAKNNALNKENALFGQIPYHHFPGTNEAWLD